jgi:DNA-binding IclR family transcriptional regulator
MKIIKSIKTSLAILNSFSKDTPLLGVTEVSKKLGLSKSTASRILSTLEQGRLVAKIPANQKYCLGSKVLELANIFLSGIEWRTHATPYLKELRNKTDETVMVFVMDGDHRVCLEKFEGSHELRPMLNIGGRYPLHAGSAGKLLLAFLPEDERKKILARTGLPRFTSSTIIGAKALEKELLLIRKRGYAISHQERMNFLSSVSVPIRDHSGKVIAAICIDGPTVRFTAEKVKEFKNLGIAAADQISRVIGFKTPNSP